MRFSTDVGSELELKLYQAVLLYRNDHGNRFMATVHGVVQKGSDGSPVLGAGQLLSTASLRELARQQSDLNFRLLVVSVQLQQQWILWYLIISLLCLRRSDLFARTPYLLLCQALQTMP